MNRVFVLDTQYQSLSPCSPKRAKQLLNSNKAAVYRYNPFTIILKYTIITPITTEYSIRLDPGALVTGIAIIGHFPKQGDTLVFGIELYHRSRKIKAALYNRRCFRATRRSKLRYRPARFLNRKSQHDGMLPSMRSRFNNIVYLVQKITKSVSNLKKCDIEVSKFDTQLMQDPSIVGAGYTTGPLHGFKTVKEYLYQRDGRKCAYCGDSKSKLEIEHIVPRAVGSDSVNNLVLSCRSCNIMKNNHPIEDFLKNKPLELREVEKHRAKPLWAAAAMNTLQTNLVPAIINMGIAVQTYTGYSTSLNRKKIGYNKEHWIDAACVGAFQGVKIDYFHTKPMKIIAIGRGSRRVVKHDKYGFPRVSKDGRRVEASNIKRVHGYSTGDYVKLNKDGEYSGIYVGRLSSIRRRGQFTIKLKRALSYFKNDTFIVKDKIDSTHKTFTLLQHGDGYEYI